MQRWATWQLFAVGVLVWGTTWHAIVYQLAETSPEWSVSLRFALAGGVVLAVCGWRGERLRFGLRQHALLALQGGLMYSLAYLLVYHAERHVPSGLVAVGYSASPLVAGIGAAVLWGTPLGKRFLLGGALGVAGVALIFWPELTRAADGGTDVASLRGFAFTLAAVLMSAAGSLAASRNGAHRLPFWPALGFGMLYGAAFSCVATAAAGERLALPVSAAWWASLLYLSLGGSVLAFACFLTLQERLGPGPASTLGVMTPLLALVVSTAFEGYRPGLPALAGLLLAVAGNALMLRPGASRAAG